MRTTRLGGMTQLLVVVSVLLGGGQARRVEAEEPLAIAAEILSPQQRRVAPVGSLWILPVCLGTRGIARTSLSSVTSCCSAAQREQRCQRENKGVRNRFLRNKGGVSDQNAGEMTGNGS